MSGHAFIIGCGLLGLHIAVAAVILAIAIKKIKLTIHNNTVSDPHMDLDKVTCSIEQAHS